MALNMKKSLILALTVFVLGFFFSCKKSFSAENKIGQAEINTAHTIRELTDAATVSEYIKAKNKLPDFYLKKNEARKLGWNPAAENLCDILPGRAIGGDVFQNREKKLPVNGKYFEADVNYNCGNRGTDRLIFDRKGNVWLTQNHYKTFEKL